MFNKNIALCIRGTDIHDGGNIKHITLVTVIISSSDRLPFIGLILFQFYFVRKIIKLRKTFELF